MSSRPDDFDDHLFDEATPQEVSSTGIPPVFGFHDRGWSEEEWFNLLCKLIEMGAGSWKDVTALVLGHLNPSQVGTSLASSVGFKRNYGKGNTMRIVLDWVYRQDGRCADCGTRLELQADHVKGREAFLAEGKDALDADFIENMMLRCRRCNVVRRPSHAFGGRTFLTTEAALMWILIVIRPRTLIDFIRMCRLYGMTMSDIRMQEAWAMAHWLSKSNPPAFGIEDNKNSYYDILLWKDNAITRVDVSAFTPHGARKLYTHVKGDARLGFLTLQADGRLRFHVQSLGFIPFSTYNIDRYAPQALCFRYSPPDRENGFPPQLLPLSPRNSHLLFSAIAAPDECFHLTSVDPSYPIGRELPEAPPYGRLVNVACDPMICRIDVIPKDVPLTRV